jgi:hypothetical protein
VLDAGRRKPGEARLLKVSIERKSLLDTELTHEDERDEVGEREALVRTTAIR